VSVRPSVCKSVRLSQAGVRAYTKTTKRITQSTPHDSPGTLVFDAKDLGEIRMGHPTPVGATFDK